MLLSTSAFKFNLRRYSMEAQRIQQQLLERHERYQISTTSAAAAEDTSGAGGGGLRQPTGASARLPRLNHLNQQNQQHAEIMVRRCRLNR